MVAITEKAEWVEQIRQIEANDPVQGGENGIDNIPHQQLANRTAYLKNRLDNFQIPADNSGLIEQLTQRIEQLENANRQIKGFQIPIGGLFETTVNYQNGGEVATAMGYGRWELYGKGRVTVGLTTTAENISKNIEEHSVKDGADNSAVFTIGETFGEFYHQLTIDEMPSHNHAQSDLFNKFTAIAEDYQNSTYYRLMDNTDGATIKDADRGSQQKDESVVNNITQEAWNLATIKTQGNNQSHNNIQPSIVVGRWKRVA